MGGLYALVSFQCWLLGWIIEGGMFVWKLVRNWKVVLRNWYFNRMEGKCKLNALVQMVPPDCYTVTFYNDDYAQDVLRGVKARQDPHSVRYNFSRTAGQILFFSYDTMWAFASALNKLHDVQFLLPENVIFDSGLTESDGEESES